MCHSRIAKIAYVLIVAALVSEASGFDCQKKFLTSDHVICNDKILLATENKLEFEYQKIRASLPNELSLRLRDDQRDWAKKWWKGCGLPRTGLPSSELRAKTFACVLNALKSRESYIQTLAPDKYLNSESSPISESAENLSEPATRENEPIRALLASPTTSADSSKETQSSDFDREQDEAGTDDSKSVVEAFVPTTEGSPKLSVEFEQEKENSSLGTIRIGKIEESDIKIYRVIINGKIGDKWCDSSRNLRGLYSEQTQKKATTINVIASEVCGKPEAILIDVDHGRAEFKIKRN